MRRFTDVNYYAALGVTSHASKSEIKAAYRVLARKTHPDAGGDPERFAQIAEAWEILSDDRERELYDAERSLRARARPYTSSGHQTPGAPERARPQSGADGDLTATQRWIKNKRRF